MPLEEPPRRSCPHLPAPPKAPIAYRSLYPGPAPPDLHGLDERAWAAIRIPAGASGPDVYRLLPTAEDHENTGYLTRTRIRYCAGEATSAPVILSKDCTFHTHPTGHPNTDMPSDQDIYHFLKWRARRAITVGARLIWAWDKTAATLRTVRALQGWEAENMIPTMLRFHRGGGDARHRFVRAALKGIGFTWGRTWREWVEGWPELLREHLRIRVRVWERLARRRGSATAG